MTLRPSVRLRLTLAYGGLFLVAGVILVALNYSTVRAGLAEAGPMSVRAVDVPAPFVDPRTGLPVTIEGQRLDQAVENVIRDRREETLAHVVRRSLLALGVISVASFGVGWAVSGRVLGPIKEITTAAQRLSGETLHERINLEGPDDELKELADTFDAMLGRLDAAFESQRRFVANASHELRTPLTVMRTEVDVTLADPESGPEELRRMGETVREATIRSEALISSLLVLARSERGLVVQEPYDLGDAAGAAVTSARAEAEAAGVTVSTALSPAPVRGDPQLLRRLVANLVENGVRHNQPGGFVEVHTGVGPRGSWVVVRNSGPVVEPDAVAGLFEPFRRLGAERVGSDHGAGLGLSIVRAVATAHRGSVEAVARADGGLELTAVLPSSVE